MGTKTSQSPPLRHRLIHSPVGELGLIASGRGLVFVGLDGNRTLADAKARGISKRFRSGYDSDSAEDSPEVFLEAAATQLMEYFEGRRKAFSVVLDLGPRISGDPLSRAATIQNPWVSSGGSFSTDAQLALLHVEYGQTATYGELAQLLRNPGAARAVGTACATNPIPIILPCHRIIRSGGDLGNYGGGLTMKRQLLDLEQRYL